MINRKLLLSKKLRKLIWKFLIVFIAIFVLFLLGKKAVSIIVVFFLILIGIVSLLWKRFIHLSLGFELITFAIVIIAIAFNPLVAIAAAIIMTVAGNYIAGRICLPMFIQIGAYCLIAIVSSFFPSSSIVLAGQVSAILFNLVLHLVYVVFMRFRIENSLMSFAINTLINFYLFSSFGPFIMGLVV